MVISLDVSTVLNKNLNSMKKPTKRTPFKFTIEHSDIIYNRIVYTNDIVNYLKKLNGPTLLGVKWKLDPLKIQVIDGVKYFEDAHGNLREMTFEL
jgi:hypothetical protein